MKLISGVEIKQDENTRYVLLEQLGKGWFSYVFKAQKKVDGIDTDIVALKCYRNDLLFHPLFNSLNDVLREGEVLKLWYQDSFDESLFQVFEDKEKGIFLACPILGEKTLKQLIKEIDYSIEERLDIAHKLLQKVQQLHEKGLLHADLKHKNILLDEDDKVNPIDLGIARKINERGQFGDPRFQSWDAYMALVFPCASSDKIDVYSLGVILWQLFTSGAKYHHGSHLNFHFSLLPLAETIKKMLSHKVAMRPELNEVITVVTEAKANFRQATIADLEQIKALLEKQDEAVALKEEINGYLANATTITRQQYYDVLNRFNALQGQEKKSSFCKLDAKNTAIYKVIPKLIKRLEKLIAKKEKELNKSHVSYPDVLQMKISCLNRMITQLNEALSKWTLAEVFKAVISNKEEHACLNPYRPRNKLMTKIHTFFYIKTDCKTTVDECFKKAEKEVNKALPKALRS